MDILYIILSYLIGSIPSGLIIGKLFKNTDIRNYGSGNLGATNAIRVLGKELGSIVLIMDLLKGGITILLARLVFNTSLDPMVFGIFAVVGHIYPIFAKFRGGKAVATSGGIILFYQPLICLIGILAFIITLLLWKMVSISSTAAAITIWSLTLLFYFSPESGKFLGIGEINIIFVLAVTVLFLFIVIRHIPNYKRILKGTESKVGQKLKEKDE